MVPLGDTVSRPRVEGEREVEVLQATLEVLAEVGYDRLTMDAVAHAARASKATLYRRWNGKLALVIDALACQKAGEVPDTGSLRGDLVASFCRPDSIGGPEAVNTLASVLTAISRDPEFAEAFRRDVIEPKARASLVIYQRALARGEIHPDTDLDLIGPALAGIVLHRHFVLGEPPTETSVARVVDAIILPAVRHDPTTSSD